MDTEKIGAGNLLFYTEAVVAYLSGPDFAQAAFKSLYEPVLCGMEAGAHCGYLHVDARQINRFCSSGSFADAIRKGLLHWIVRRIERLFQANGALNTEATIVDGIWKFDFRITRYERDSDHRFEVIEDAAFLADVPDDERLGRYVELKISIIE